MGAGALMMAVATVLALGALALVLYSTAKSIKNERSRGRSIWREFGLGLILMILFFGTWLAQGITQWQTFTDEFGHLFYKDPFSYYVLAAEYRFVGEQVPTTRTDLKWAIRNNGL